MFDYRNYRNLYNTVIRGVKQMFFEKELVKAQSNLKKPGPFWKTPSIKIVKNRPSSSLVVFPKFSKKLPVFGYPPF